ncbi:MAG: hypothetical protein WBQ23_12065 [Bacteroidota bacterium]
MVVRYSYLQRGAAGRGVPAEPSIIFPDHGWGSPVMAEVSMIKSEVCPSWLGFARHG